MAKCALKVVHRPQVDDPIEDRHARFVERQRLIQKPWDGEAFARLERTPIEGEFVSVVQLKPALDKGFRGYITYSLRHKDYLKDEGMYSDRIIINFDSKKVDYRTLISQVPGIAKAFDAYRAEIDDDEIRLEVWPTICDLSRSTGRDIDGRDSVYLLNPVSFFDRELCRRAFNKTPQEIAARLRGKFEVAEATPDDVFLVYKSGGLDREEYLNADRVFRAAIA